MKARQDRFWYLVGFFLLWALFSLAAASFLDPDFGWHLKTGEWIWENQALPKTDLFSYTMPNYPWRLHSWFSEVIFFKLFEIGGYSGLAIFVGLVLTAAFWLTVGRKKIAFVFFPLSLAVLAGLGYVSVRPRVVSVLLAAVCFSVLRESFEKPKKLYILPFLFLIWSNLHGGFPIVVVVLGLAAIVDLGRFLRGEKEAGVHFWALLLAGALSGLAVAVNPYGFSIYEEIFKEMALGQKAHLRILEWLPYGTFSWEVIFYTGIFLALAFFFRKRLNLFEAGVSFLLLGATLLSSRFLIYFLLFSLPAWIDLLERLFGLVVKKERFWQLGRYRWLFLSFFLVLIIVSFLQNLGLFSAKGKPGFYPAGAVSYLRENEIEGRLFSVYNWGGYLIWQLPEKKTFVDGRMAIWQEDGYSAFEEERELRTGEVDFGPVFAKHGIGLALLPAEEEEEFSLGEELVESGWQVIYEDETARLFKEHEGGD
jgi:hypothetical protein